VAFDLDRYLARIGLPAPVVPDAATLRSVHLAHVSAIPFENLDIQMGLPIRLDLASLHRKLIERRRGGYCFEHNTILLHALRALGFDAVACEARVRQGAAPGHIRARTHMVLLVRLDGARWLADAGFGGDGILEPVLEGGGNSTQHGSVFRLAPEDGRLVLQSRHAGVWIDLYAFAPEPCHPIDFELGNWYTSTHPDSIFVTSLTAQRALPDARHILRNLTYTIATASGVESREIDRQALVPLLRDTFAIDVPADARFRALDDVVAPV
jgi:N-hydroxyarylamine O-acetyltransferase